MLRRTIVNRVRERRARLAWLAQAAAAAEDTIRADALPPKLDVVFCAPA